MDGRREPSACPACLPWPRPWIHRQQQLASITTMMMFMHGPRVVVVVVVGMLAIKLSHAHAHARV